MLHWPWSWWRNGYEPSQLDWSKVNEETFDLMVRSAMFHRLGVSYPLPKLAPALRERLSHHLRLFKNHIAPLLATATLESLTESPHRGGGGERSPAWQLSSGIGSSEEVHLVLNLALDIDSRRSEFELTQLDSEEEYAVVDLETGDRVEARASDLTPNFLAKHARNARSWILEIRPLKARQ
jgi:alpha-galactosidase